MSKRSWTKKSRLVTGHQAGCDIVTFHTKGGKKVQTVRCRKRVGGLKRAAKLRYSAMKRAGEICRKATRKGGKVKLFSTSCG